MKLKSKLLAILFAVAAIGFTSCNDDDNNEPQNPQQFAFADAIFATQTNESTLNALDMTMSVSYTDNKDIVLPVTSLYSQNMMNRTKAEQTTSKYKGVHLNPKLNKWAVEVKCEGKRINLGLFENEEEAARAYDAKALELFGEFAAINFPEEHPEANPVSTLDTQAKNN